MDSPNNEPSDEKRVKFDFEIEFSNGGGIQGQDFRLDLTGDEISDTELANYIVRDMRLLMVKTVRILNKQIINEEHKRSIKEAIVVIVDAFATKPFSGNPAAVCLLEQVASEEWMQKVAKEFNLPATAFLMEQENSYELRWFSPEMELTFCGHGTLASAHVLWQLGKLLPNKVGRFNTKAGLLTARKAQDQIELNLPAEPVRLVEAPPVLLQALKVNPRFVAKGQRDYIVEVESEIEVVNLKPDFALLKTLDARGCIVTSQSNSSASGYDIVSRCFFPGTGINEDPVTGSAHCSLASYWHSRLDKDVFRAYQASERGGLLHLQLEGERVVIGGQAVTIMQGSLEI